MPDGCCAVGPTTNWSGFASRFSRASWSVTRIRCENRSNGARLAADRLRVPFWTVDADVIVPTALLKKEQYAARTISPRIHALLDEFLTPSRNPKARIPWESPKRIGIPLNPCGPAGGISD